MVAVKAEGVIGQGRLTLGWLFCRVLRDEALTLLLDVILERSDTLVKGVVIIHQVAYFMVLEECVEG